MVFRFVRLVVERGLFFLKVAESGRMMPHKSIVGGVA